MEAIIATASIGGTDRSSGECIASR